MGDAPRYGLWVHAIRDRVPGLTAKPTDAMGRTAISYLVGPALKRDCAGRGLFRRRLVAGLVAIGPRGVHLLENRPALVFFA